MGVSTSKDIAGLSAKAGKAAIEPLQLVDTGEGRLLLPEHPQIRMVASIDGLLLLAASHLEKIPNGGGGVKELPGLAIVDRGAHRHLGV